MKNPVKLIPVAMVISYLLILDGCDTEHVGQSKTAAKVGDITSERILAIDKEPGSWLTGGRDYQQTYHSPLKKINRENVSKLGFAWQFETGSTKGLEATPIVVDGVMYSSGPKGAVYVLDAKTGDKRWQFEPEIDPDIARKVCCGMVNRGVVVWQGKVYVGSLDGYLYALDADDGSVVWKVDTFTDRERGYTLTGAPYIAKDLVIIGNSGAEFDARGYVTAYDIHTGKQVWRFFTVPGNPDKPFEHEELEEAAKTWDPKSLWQVGLGGTVWDGMAYDPKLNLLYVGTGNAAPYPRKLRSPSGGDNLYLASILAINPDTGRLVWYYQTTPEENWDFTATQKMILADLTINGNERKVIMQAPKNGFFYTIDRITGELISAKPYVAVNWASHIDMKTGRPVETGQGEYFEQPKLVFPSPAGGHNWQPMAYNLASGLVYIPTLESGAIWIMPEEPFKYQKGGLNMASTYVFPMRGEWGMDGDAAKGLPPLEQLAAGQPDTVIRGFLKAWDPVSQKLVWQLETSDQWVGTDFAFWNGGGVMTSAGGLVFQGRGSGEFTAINSETGEKLLSLQVGSSMMAAPMTYTIDGEQYITIMAALGGGGGQSFPPGSAAYEYGNKGRIITFKLGGGKVPFPEKIVYDDESFPMPSALRKGTAEQINVGSDLFTRNCAKCHATMDGRGAGIPDLRRMKEKAHNEFNDILLKGIRADKGMGNYSELLSADDVEAIHAYLIEWAWKTYEKEQGPSKPHQPKE